MTGVNFQGLTQHVMLAFLPGDDIRLIERNHGERLLASARFAWASGQAVGIRIGSHGQTVSAVIEGRTRLTGALAAGAPAAGGVVLMCEEGALQVCELAVQAAASAR